MGPGRFAAPQRFPSGVFWRRAHDRTALGGRDGRRPHDAGLPGRARGRLGGGLLGRGGPRSRGARQRAARARRAQGRRLRDPRPDEPRVGAVRLRARADRRGRRGDLREQLAEGLPLRARALRRGRRAGRGRGTARKARRRLARPRADVRRPRRAARPRARVRRQQPDGARRGRGTGGRGRSLHLHLHLGHDRPAQGLHDPPPQLLRDGDLRRPRAGVRLRRRRDAALPAARAQLRPADAPARRAQGLHDGLLPGSVAYRRGDAGRAADAAAERAEALREGAHGGAGAVRSGAGAAATAARLGPGGRAAGERAAPARRAAHARAGAAAPRGRPARLLEGQGPARRAAATGGLRRRAARQGDRRVLPLDRHPHRRGLGPDRVHDRRLGQPARALSLRHRRARAAGLRGACWATTASC